MASWLYVYFIPLNLSTQTVHCIRFTDLRTAVKFLNEAVGSRIQVSFFPFCRPCIFIIGFFINFPVGSRIQVSFFPFCRPCIFIIGFFINFILENRLQCFRGLNSTQIFLKISNYRIHLMMILLYVYHLHGLVCPCCKIFQAGIQTVI